MATAAEPYDPYAIPTRRMTRGDLLKAAAFFGIDPAGLETEILRAEVKKVGDARWADENREAMEQWNAWVEKNGAPLDRYRLF